MSASTSTSTLAAHATAEEKSEHGRRLFGGILGVVLAVIVRLVPMPHGLSSIGHSILAVLTLTVCFWVFDVLNNAVTSLLMLGLMIAVGVKPVSALGAFSGLSFWILLVVLFYGYAMQHTGLAKRISYVILSWLPATYGGILTAFFIIGLVLSLGVPSMTVRTAILTPIAWALVESLGIPPKSRESSLIMLSTLEMAIMPGCATLYGSLWGPFIIGLFGKEHLAIAWLPWARVMSLPTLIWCVLLLVGNYIVLKPQLPLNVGKSFAKEERQKLGKMSKQEIVVSVVLIVSILYWIFQSRLGEPTYLVGLFALAVFAATGILREKDFPRAVSWSLLLFLGCVFALPDIIEDNKMTDWIASFILPLVHKVSGDVLLLCLLLATAMLLLRFADPSGFLIMTILFLPVAALLKGSPISPYILVGALLMGAHPFWALYSNFWCAMMHGMTNYQSFEDSYRVRLAHVYAIMSLITLAISVGYWRFIGAWH